MDIRAENRMVHDRLEAENFFTVLFLVLLVMTAAIILTAAWPEVMKAWQFIKQFPVR